VVRKKLEIKWQAARTFDHGCLYEKGLATQAVCRRDRQKEKKKKYLWQKKETYRQSKTFREEKKEDDESQRLGDRILMQAADA
jgi:hypothetical protein